MSSLRRALWLLAIAGLALGLIELGLILSSDHEENRGLVAALVLFLAWSFIGTGLYAWARRPDNRIGAMMTGVGFAWFLLGLGATDSDWLFTISWTFDGVAIVLFIRLLLAYPSGRLETTAERLIVWVGFFDVIVIAAITALFDDPSLDFPEAPESLLLISSNENVANALDAVATMIGIGLLVGVMVILVRRWRSESGPRRAAITPVLATGGASVILYVLGLITEITGLPGWTRDIFILGAIIVFALVPFAFLFGLLRTRFSRAGAVGELVERLGTSRFDERDLQFALADAFGDPDLTIAYWYPEGERYVDAEGQEVVLPGDDDDRAVSDIEHDGRSIAALVHDRELLDEPDLIRAVGAAAALALENERLEAELRARIEELRASRARIVEAGYAARQQIERDLHDGAQQRLVALSLDLKLARSTIDGDPAEAAKMLERASADLDLATAELRELARGIHPAVLSDQGLEEALRALAGRAPLPVELGEMPDTRLPEAIEAASYFVIAEALTNVARYAEASHAAVSVVRMNGRVTVEVRDDGVGGADPAAGSGLRGLADRVAALDGTMSVVSRSGQGTVVTAELPCE